MDDSSLHKKRGVLITVDHRCPPLSFYFRIRHSVTIGHKFAGIRVGRGSRSFRKHRTVPSLPVGFESSEDILFALLIIGPLARILHDIEQELVASNSQIFPVTFSHCAPALKRQ